MGLKGANHIHHQSLLVDLMKVFEFDVVILHSQLIQELNVFGENLAQLLSTKKDGVSNKIG